MPEKTDKLVYIVTVGGESPEKATLPFVMANAALAMDAEAVIVLQSTGVFLAQKGYGEHIFAAGLAPFSDLMEAFREDGGRLLVCVPCMRERKLEQEDMIEGVELVAAAAITKELLSASNVLVY